VHFDPFDPQFFEDPWPAYRWMRREAPVYRCVVKNHRLWPHFWMLSRYADVRDALADWETFSSAKGTLIDTDISLIPPNIFNMDPPRHDELRNVLARVLTPSRIAGLEQVVRAHARELAARFAPRGAADIATEYAQPIPTLTMCALLDLPIADQQRFLGWNMDTLAGADFTAPAALRAYAEMEEYWRGLVAERRERPGEDLISRIIHTEVKGEEISDAEIAGFCSLLHDAAQNTTMNMISNAVIALGRHPRERRKLIADPARWPDAVEELMRYVSPVQGLARVTTRDVQIAGVTIRAGEQVLMLYGAANHDEDFCERPEELDFDRIVKGHLVFGHGIHHCLGHSVARLELRIALEVLLDTIGEWEIEERGLVRNQLVPTRGVAHAPVRFTPARG